MAHQVMAQFEAQNSLDRGIDIGLAEMPRFHPVRKVPDQLRQQARLAGEAMLTGIRAISTPAAKTFSAALAG